MSTYREQIYKVCTVTDENDSVGVTEIDSTYESFDSRCGLASYYPLVENEIESDRISKRDAPTFIHTLIQRFECVEVAEVTVIVNMIEQYKLLARRFERESVIEDSVFITECRKDGKPIAYVYMGMEKPYLWNLIPVQVPYSSNTLEIIRKHYRDILKLAGVTPLEYEILEVVIARYCLILSPDVLGY